MVEVSKPESDIENDKSIMRLLKIYHSPRLENLGDLRSLTLGGSVGELESAYPYGGDIFPTFEYN
jgi:hypothetical protein